MSLPFSPYDAPPPAQSLLIGKAANARRSGSFLTALLAALCLVAPLIYLIVADHGHRTDYERLDARVVQVSGSGDDRRVTVKLPDGGEDTITTDAGTPGESLPVWRKLDTRELSATQPALSMWEWLAAALAIALGFWLLARTVRSFAAAKLLKEPTLDAARGVLALRTTHVREQALQEGERLRHVTFEVTHSTMDSARPGSTFTLSAPISQLPGPEQLQGMQEAWVMDEHRQPMTIVHQLGSPVWWTGSRSSRG